MLSSLAVLPAALQRLRLAASQAPRIVEGKEPFIFYRFEYSIKVIFVVTSRFSIRTLSKEYSINKSYYNNITDTHKENLWYLIQANIYINENITSQYI